MALKFRTVALTVIGALTAGALAVVAFRTDPVPVDLHRLARGPMQVTIDADGRTRIREVYEVAAPIDGTALRAPVRVGDAVTAGKTVVAIVEPIASGLLDTRTRIQAEAAVREAEAGLHVARSRLSQTREELSYARRTFERTSKLVERGVVSLTRLEDTKEQLAIAKAAEEAAVSELEMAKSTLDRARAALIEPGGDGEGDPERCCLRLMAPVNGRVLEIDVVSERPVVAGTRLLSVGQPSDLEIVADLLSTDAVRLAPGDRAIVERWGGETPLEARVAKVEPSAYTRVSALGIEEQRVDVIFDLVTPATERPELGDGFSVFLRIVAWEGADVLQVPLSAIFRRGDGWAVFTAEDGIARLRPVEIGRRNSAVAQVLGGLRENEWVITHPSEKVADGTPVAQRVEM